MGYMTFSVDSYREARRDYGVTHDVGVTHHAERQAQQTGHLNRLVDPAVDPVRCSRIRLNPHNGRWIATLGCPMDIEVSCDTTGSMGGEVDTEMKVLPDMYSAVAQVLPGYDPQLCLGIFGDVVDRFVLCRPQFEMEAPKIVEYLKEMAPQRNGGDSPEDPQYSMFARAYLTDAYTNRIGLKGYHFIVTDATCHKTINKNHIRRIFGEDIFETELTNMTDVPSFRDVVAALKEKTHQFILVVDDYGATAEFWEGVCGEKSVIGIRSTSQLPEVISTIIGLTEGTVDITEIESRISNSHLNQKLIRQLSNIAIGAQAELRHNLPHPVPVAGDIFENKGDDWPVDKAELAEDSPKHEVDEIQYL